MDSILSKCMMKNSSCTRTITSHQNTFSFKRILYAMFYFWRTNIKRIFSILYCILCILISRLNVTYKLQTPYCPMLWYLSYPVDAAVTHGNIGIETFCDSLGDDRLLIGFQFLYHLLLKGNHVINLTTYLVKIIRYLLLLVISG